MTKARKIILYILCFALMMTCGAAFAHVYAKYVKEVGGSGAIGGDSGYDLPYEVEMQFVANTQEEFFNAIEYGYPYIKIADSVKQPFIITEDAKALSRTMILDLNGVEVQKNGREAMLIVEEGVTLTITDSSKDKKGGLYNPVGSVLTVEGGDVVVREGKFESGPRYWEYYSDDTNAVVTDETVTGTDGKTYPVFNPDVEKVGTNTIVDGNVYFDQGWGTSIPKDTYCYFVTSDGLSATNTKFDTKSTEPTFTYSYYAYPASHVNAYQYMATKPANGQINIDYIEVMVYGYADTIKAGMVKSSDDTTDTSPHYAAIKMKSGDLKVAVTLEEEEKIKYEQTEQPMSPQKMGSGCFISYFGIPETSCIYMEGGNMHVESAGAFVTLNPEYIKSIAEKNTGVEVSTENYLALEGRSNCIYSVVGKNNEGGTLTVDYGVFRSYNLNCINLAAGNITINGGHFQKRSTLQKYELGRAAIFIGDGTCTVQDASFKISSTATDYLWTGNEAFETAKQKLQSEGKYTEDADVTKQHGYWGENVYGIYATGGSVELTDTTMEIKGNYATGIYAGRSSSSNIFLNGVSINLNGKHSYGVYTLGGTVTTNKSEKTERSMLTLDKEYSYGIYMEGGEVDSDVTDYTLTGTNSGAIRMSGQESILHIKNGNVNMSGVSSVGIYSLGGHILSQYLNYTLTGASSFGIYATAGEINLENSNMEIQSCIDSYGILGVSRDVEHGLHMDIYNSTIAVGAAWDEELKDFKWAEDGRNSGDASKTDPVNACMGISLANPDPTSACYISLFKCNLYSIDVGVGVRGGALFLQGGGNIKTRNSTAIASSGGNVYVGTINNMDEFVNQDTEMFGKTINTIDVKAMKEYYNTQISANTSAEAKITAYQYLFKEYNSETVLKVDSEMYGATVEGTEVEASRYYKSPIVNIETDAEGNNKYTTSYRPFPSYDGVYINGGNFTAVEKIELTFRGLKNKIQKTFADQYENSFAVRVLGGNAILLKANITNSVGGGVSVEKFVDQDGNTKVGEVILGQKNGNNADIRIATTGSERDQKTATTNGITNHGNMDNLFKFMGIDSPDATWKSCKNYTGGTGLNVVGGKLTAFHGMITAAYGTALNANDAENIDVYDGYYFGSNDNIMVEAWAGAYRPLGGPAAYYGLKVMGQSVVNIYNGNFVGGNGGAYVTGATVSFDGNGKVSLVEPYVQDSTKRAKVLLYAGRFGKIFTEQFNAKNENILTADGDCIIDETNLNKQDQEALETLGYFKDDTYISPVRECTDGFNLSDGVDIVFGAKKIGEATKDTLFVKATRTSVAVNSIRGAAYTSSNYAPQVTFYYGMYSGDYGNNGNLGAGYSQAFYNNHMKGLGETAYKKLIKAYNYGGKTTFGKIGDNQYMYTTSATATYQ